MFNKVGFIFVFVVVFLMQSSAQENAISNAMNNKSEIKISDKKAEEKNCQLWAGWRVGLNYGITKFRGDITQYDHYPAYQENVKFFELRTAISLNLEKRINSFYALAFEFTSGSFAGLRRANEYTGYEITEQWEGYNFYEGNGDKFTTSFTEADILLNLNITNLMAYFFEARRGEKLYFDGKIGYGFNIFNSLRTNLFTDSYIADWGYEMNGANLGTQKKSFLEQPSETVYIYGVRANYKVNKKLSLNIDYTVRNGLSDAWDASIMNTQYVTDHFTFLSLGFAYKIGRQINESDWTSPIDVLKDDVATLNITIEGFTDDMDNDGVADAFDKSPNTPLGVAVDGSGNALDVDMDNVPDYRDADPFSNRDVLVDANGVEFDGDKDGVPNSKDLEHNTPVGTMVNQFGMNVNRTVYQNSAGMIYFPSIFFNSGSAIVESSNENRIATMALMLKNNAEISLNVIGHADNVGDTKFNKKLGLKRAKAVINYLVSNYNIDVKRLNAITKGEDEPLTDVTTINNGIEGSSALNTLSEINRRVDFEISD
jgi:outer membrane protein OmpA-like peptidoglycan-associated protein